MSSLEISKTTHYTLGTVCLFDLTGAFSISAGARAVPFEHAMTLWVPESGKDRLHDVDIVPWAPYIAVFERERERERLASSHRRKE